MSQSHPFLEQLRRRPLLADGAMGTMLYAKGASSEQCLEYLVVSRPGWVTEIHQAYAAAGAEVLKTHTFGANRIRLAEYGLAEKVRDAIQPFDRIVLYVDDLDRCRPDHVVAMLEAVHLLLALDLFVAVVAVDARWLTRSLEVHYKDLLGTEEHEDDRGLRVSTPQGYLEKIFQITYALGPMDPRRFSDYVRFLAANEGGVAGVLVGRIGEHRTHRLSAGNAIPGPRNVADTRILQPWSSVSRDQILPGEDDSLPVREGSVARASEIDPAWGKPLFALGRLAMATGNAAGAIVYFERMLAVDPYSPDAVQARANLEQARR